MTKAPRATIAVVLAAAALVAVASGAGASGKTCTIHYKEDAAHVKNIKGGSVLAGIIDGKLCGKGFHGADRLSTTTSGGISTTHAQLFLPRGSIKATFTTHGTASGGFSGSATITGGTGAYKGSTGSLTINGHTPKNSHVTTSTADGSVTR